MFAKFFAGGTRETVLPPDFCDRVRTLAPSPNRGGHPVAERFRTPQFVFERGHLGGSELLVEESGDLFVRPEQRGRHGENVLSVNGS
jgi:hypothetical protein